MALLFDKKILDQLADDVGPVLPDLIAAFLKELSDAEADYPDLLAAENWSQLEIRAHALKSTSRTFGAVGLGDIAETMEACARQKQMPPAELTRKLIAGLAETRAFIQDNIVFDI